MVESRCRVSRVFFTYSESTKEFRILIEFRWNSKWPIFRHLSVESLREVSGMEWKNRVYDRLRDQLHIL